RAPGAWASTVSSEWSHVFVLLRRRQGQPRPHACTPPPQSGTAPRPQIMEQSSPDEQRSTQPPVSLHVKLQAPPWHVVSQLPVPLQTISEPMPTSNVQAFVPLQVAEHPTPHAASQPAVPLQTVVQSSPQIMSHA